MEVQNRLKEISKGFAATLVFFIVLEVLLRLTYFIRNSMVGHVPLPYTIGDDYGPVPPWWDALRILEPDSALIWKNRPNLRRTYVDLFSPAPTEDERVSMLRKFLPRLPKFLKRNPMWEISLNSEGFRNENFPEKKISSIFRIICLGDSWTFGANVGQEQAYPQRLKALLKEEFPQAKFEVFNLGVLGYSSYQGLELLRQRVFDLDPDFVLIGFAMNDSSVPGYRDKDLYPEKQSVTLPMRIASVLEKIESYKLLRYLALILKYQPKGFSDQFKAAADSEQKITGRQDYDKVEPWTRVSMDDYEKNIREMINLARSRGAGVILLFNELWTESPYRRILERLAQTESVPLIDSSTLLAAEKAKLEKDFETELDLRPGKSVAQFANPNNEVIFRVYASDPVSTGIYIVGNHRNLGNLVPNKIRMYDDGTHGDQRPGDHVWSYSAEFERGSKLSYVYTNSGRRGQWEGLDVPTIRTFHVEGTNNERKLYTPIESFGKLYMQADNWHTNAAGYEIIAEAVLAALENQQNVKEYLRRVQSSAETAEMRPQ